MIRRLCGLLPSLTICALPCTAAAAPDSRADAFPRFEIAGACRDQARYAYAATLGQTDVDKEFDACMARETAAQADAGRLWTRADADRRRDCVALAGARYSMLGRCLDPRR